VSVCAGLRETSFPVLIGTSLPAEPLRSPGTARSPRPPLCRSTPGTFLLHFPRRQVGLLGYYTDFENHAKLRPSHRINTLAYANGPGTRRAGKRSKPLGTNALTPPTAALAYANPGRGDVSLFCRRASAVVFAIRPLINAANPARPGPGPWPLPKKQPHICQNFLLN